MFSIFVPDIYQKNIFDINFKKLKKNGIKCIIFDLDNTLAPVNVKSPSKKVKDLMEDLKELKLKLIIMSNSTKKRVEPFKDILCIDSSYLSFKPLKKRYKKIMKIYGFKDMEIACVGDQLLTDIWGANRMGFTSILINPIGILDFAPTKINRFIEETIYNYLEKKDLLKKGEYYE
ncbi:MAG: YqeG family HAD IIIA-type phosphatase [Bacilli bacterium]|nr:YqeG family HAD IIIA-type phosphatase [Bacilli bacterium]MDD4406856.1 YqeG family HAD IIIA-type phosphatase [Bacilli bacterium]